jgi:hypothetical protein
MTATEYTIEIAISLEQNSELNLIELARRVYQRRGAARLPNRKRKPIRSDEFIDGPETALIELAEANPLFDQAGVHLKRVGCGLSSVGRASQSHPRLKSAAPDIYFVRCATIACAPRIVKGGIGRQCRVWCRRS